MINVVSVETYIKRGRVVKIIGVDDHGRQHIAKRGRQGFKTIMQAYYRSLRFARKNNHSDSISTDSCILGALQYLGDEVWL